MSPQSQSVAAGIEALVKSTGAVDASNAVRQMARELVTKFVQSFGEPVIPFNLEALASFIGIPISNEQPLYSTDGELAADKTGKVIMRINSDRPETRQRFSIAHEISHTFFPGYSNKVQCRTDARHRHRDNPDDHLEILCDVGASELLFPDPWFGRDAAVVSSAEGLGNLARTYKASTEATLRHFAEISAKPIAAVFFGWKLKPVQKRQIPGTEQSNLFGFNAAEDARAAAKLRIEYNIPSATFSSAGHFLPKDKSVESDGPLYQAASTESCQDGECDIDFGTAHGRYRILAVPLYTSDDEKGPNGEVAVAAILEPLNVTKPKRKIISVGPSLFDA